MQTVPVDIYETLESVNWSPKKTHSDLLRKAGYENGFCGLGDLSYQTQEPHHVRQVHGIDAIEATEATLFPNNQRPPGDAIYTRTASAIAVKTADCLPVLIASSQTNFAMAIHAGWRGLTSLILFNALKIYSQFSKIEEILIGIGPAISSNAFEVGPEVIKCIRDPKMRLGEAGAALAINKGKPGKWHVDLQLAAVLQFYLAGVKPHHIEVIRSCTRDETSPSDAGQSIATHVWHSYRRDGQTCGSNWSWIQGRQSRK
jgi:polyphenol oxidase